MPKTVVGLFEDPRLVDDVVCKIEKYPQTQTAARMAAHSHQRRCRATGLPPTRGDWVWAAESLWVLRSVGQYRAPKS